VRPPIILVCSLVLIVAGSLTTLSVLQGQEHSAPPPPPGAKPAPQSAPQRPGHDISKWPFFSKQVYLAAQRGSEWLQRANRGDGRFIAGYVPALRAPLEGDSFLRQAGAAFALARAASYFNDDQAAAIARQAVLTLLEDTAPLDPKNPVVRCCTLPAGMANPLGAAAALVQAIHELPAPASDLLDQADQLCNFIRRAQRPDGSLACGEPGPDGKSAALDNEAIDLYTGEALYAVILSHQHRPSPWKLESIQKALPVFQARWRANKSPAGVARHTAAFTQAFLQTKDKFYADFIFEMNDWLCTLQYNQLDPQHPLWVGGFMSFVDGKPVPAPPQIVAAAWTESLVDAARVAREVGDVPRWERYKAALQRGLQFLTTLQYTEANSQHFADWYRPMIVGAFHASHTEGNIRLDFTQQAVSAMLAYLTHKVGLAD
jgi:hypothetical protein